MTAGWISVAVKVLPAATYPKRTSACISQAAAEIAFEFCSMVSFSPSSSRNGASAYAGFDKSAVETTIRPPPPSGRLAAGIATAIIALKSMALSLIALAFPIPSPTLRRKGCQGRRPWLVSWLT